MINRANKFILMVLVLYCAQMAAGQQIGGLGVRYFIDTANKVPMILTIVPGSPAAELQLKTFCFIDEINGISLKGKTKQEINDLISGPVGSEASIGYTPWPLPYRTATFKRAVPDPDPLFNIWPKKGQYWPVSSGDELKDNFKDSFLAIINACPDSFKSIKGAFHRRNTNNRYSYYESRCGFYGAFNIKIAVDGHRYTANYAFSEDSVDTYLRFLYLVHLVQASLGNGLVTELPFNYVRNPKNSRELFYGMHISACPEHRNWEGRNISVDYMPSTTVENKNMYTIVLNIYVK